MNTKQTAALNLFVSMLCSQRVDLIPAGTEVKHTTMETDGKVLVTLELPNFPVVSIGKSGGFDMPAIRSYPQNGTLTALDACIAGDKHLARQSSGTRTKRAVVAPLVPVVPAVIDSFADVPAV